MIILSEEELSRVYTINLSKVLLSPANRRTKRAINMIKEFATRHMKAEEIKIDEELNRQMWQRGIKHPPRKVRVKMIKDEDGVVTVSLYSEEAKEKEEVAEEKPAALEVAAPATAAETVTEVAAEKPEAKVPEVEELEEKVEAAVEVKEEKRKPEKEEEREKILLSEEELAEIIAEEAGVEGEEKESEKRRGRKSGNKESE